LRAKTLLIAKHPYDTLKIVCSLCNMASNNMAIYRKMHCLEIPLILLNHHYRHVSWWTFTPLHFLYQ